MLDGEINIQEIGGWVYVKAACEVVVFIFFDAILIIQGSEGMELLFIRSCSTTLNPIDVWVLVVHACVRAHACLCISDN